MADADAPRMVKMTVKPAMNARIPRSSRPTLAPSVLGVRADRAVRPGRRRPVSADPTAGSTASEAPPADAGAPTVTTAGAVTAGVGRSSAPSSAADRPETIDR